MRTTLSSADLPTEPRERIKVVDVIRGFALFGILIVNMELFSAPTLYGTPFPAGGSESDRVIDLWITFFARGRFYSLFSLLFGMGLALQMLRLEARGVRFIPLYSRRLLVLLGFGVFHSLFLWHGDILVTYAVLGAFLLLFRKKSSGTLLTWVAVLFVAPIMYSALTRGIQELRATSGEGAGVRTAVEATAAEDDEARSLEAVRRYGSGTWGEIMGQRVQDLQREYLPDTLRSTLPQIFMMFLLGLAIGRSRMLEDVDRHLPILRLAWWLGALSGFLELVLLLGWILPGRSMPGVLDAAWGGIHQTNRTMLCLFYFSTLVLLFRSDAWARILSALSAPGRMALTNYLLQSIICTTVFYSYGLGLYGKVGAEEGLVISCAIFLVQLVASNLWLKRFRFGPAEWLWRTLTYGRRQSFVVEAG